MATVRGRLAGDGIDGAGVGGGIGALVADRDGNDLHRVLLAEELVVVVAYNRIAS
jgi:hypothetical protein